MPAHKYLINYIFIYSLINKKGNALKYKYVRPGIY